LEELLQRTSATVESSGIFEEMGRLQQRCAQAEIAARPSFSEIRHTLEILLAQQLRMHAVAEI
jgi:hypothetical protein